MGHPVRVLPGSNAHGPPLADNVPAGRSTREDAWQSQSPYPPLPTQPGPTGLLFMEEGLLADGTLSPCDIRRCKPNLWIQILRDLNVRTPGYRVRHGPRLVFRG